MRLLLQAELLHRVADRWARQYGERSREMHDGRDAADILAKLRRLRPATITAAKVEEIIGNSSWTTYDCHGCDGRSPVVVEMGGSYGAGRALCPECVYAAARVLDEAGKATRRSD